ncbi:uncharacterized protein LOC62_07G009473 [Vanrija pseudolonga]|uniref:Uncharacterized protein n=1 Tax=Vanrija pseudolonga TaxID=143232 RepID=A0AAF0YFP0_9TREE|nr:hypothetical protein LOC62_07G009473 [Vanrija pseudolonga]
MFTTGALPPCCDGCDPLCKALAFGVDGTFTIGLHTDGYKAELWDGAPQDIDDLKYHLGIWFSKHSEVFFLWVMDHVNKNITAKCGDKCEVMFHHPRFLYDSQSPRNIAYLTKPNLPKSSSGNTKRQKNKKVKAGTPSTRNVIPSSCHKCFTDLFCAMMRELFATATPVQSTSDNDTTTPTDPGSFTTLSVVESADAAADTTGSTSLPLPAAPTARPRATRKVQTCFCEECENPPARYARIDDSDLED